MEELIQQELKDKILLRLSKILNRSLCLPYEVLITLTNRCNLKCIMCSFSNSNMDIADELKTKDIINMIDQIAKLNIKGIVFSGGEPFLRDDLFEIIHYASKNDIKNSSLLTNGTIINEEIISKINSSGLKSICVSIDGLENTHDYIRGRGTFKKSMDFIQIVQKQCPQVSLSITSIIMNRNLEDIPKLIKLYKEMRINLVSFQPVIYDNTNWNDKQKRDDLWVSEAKLHLLDRVIDEITAFKKSNDIINNDYNFLESIRHYYRGDICKKIKRLNCYEGFRRFTITAGGRIWICGTEMKASIVKEGLKRCWESSEVKKKRKEMLNCRQRCLQACAFERRNDSLFLLVRKWLRLSIKNWIKMKLWNLFVANYK